MWKCRECGERFAFKAQLDGHKKLVHQKMQIPHGGVLRMIKQEQQKELMTDG